MNPSTCYARNYELDKLAGIFEPDGPDIIALYGITGIGKSTLLREFIKCSKKNIFMFNCQLIEPTAQSFNKAFAQLLNLEDSTLESMARQIKHQQIIVLDQFESFKLLETWFRREFMVAMHNKIRLVFSGRVAPDYQWLLNPPSYCRYYSLNLSSLSFHDSIEYLQQCGHCKISAIAINQFASGHPVALHLASAAILEHPGRELFDIPLENVIQTLADYFVEDIQDPQLRRALEATSTVRRVSESVLAAMLDLDDRGSLYNKLGQLSFVEHRPDGLSLHDVLKHALATTLKARSPNKFSEYRNKASRILRQEMKTADSSNLWRYTADIIYLVDNRVIRDAFFPPNDHREYSVEPAQLEDREAIMAIINKHDPQASQALYQHWFSNAPDTFHSVKDKTNTIVGFYCLINPALVSDNLIKHDPLTAAWWLDHQKNNNPEKSQQALFIRRWLSIEEGESPSAIQAACWLDIKRSYLTMRPNLRRVYLTVEHLSPYAMAAQSLGFTVLD
ncbi:MAG: AAA family ATPase, partial [Psychromonas sp.]